MCPPPLQVCQTKVNGVSHQIRNLMDLCFESGTDTCQVALFCWMMLAHLDQQIEDVLSVDSIIQELKRHEVLSDYSIDALMDKFLSSVSMKTLHQAILKKWRDMDPLVTQQKRQPSHLLLIDLYQSPLVILYSTTENAWSIRNRR